MLRYDIRTGAKKIKTKTLLAISGAGLAAAGAVLAVTLPLAAKAAGTQIIVTPTNQQGWSTADTRPGGAVTYSNDTTAPGNPHNGALELTTDSTNAAKAQYLHATNTALSDVTELSYSTKQISASSPVGDPSYQVATCLGGIVSGACVGYTNLVYEPYWNGTVVSGNWQPWNVMNGQLWSSASYSDGSCTVTSGAGGPPFYTIVQLQAACPNAVVVGFGVNIGTYNPSYDVEADLVDFNGTTYNFEPYAVATDKDACKNGGWTGLADANGNSFKNQGDCVSYVATGGRNAAAH